MAYSLSTPVDWTYENPEPATTDRLVAVPGYAQHRLEPTENGQRLLVFFKEGADAEMVIQRAREDVALPDCIRAGSCSGEVWKSTTPYSLRELQALVPWLEKSPLRPWIQMRVTLPELMMDEQKSVVHWIVTAPTSAHETLERMSSNAGIPPDMLELQPPDRYTN